VQREKYLLIGLTSSRECDTCCSYEPVIASLLETYFQNRSSQFFDKQVKVARIDVAENDWFKQLHPDARFVPNWLMYVDGRPYYLRRHHIASRFITQVSRLVEPFTQIGSLAGFDRLLAFSQQDASGRHLTRNKVVGLFADAEDYEGHIENFKRLALDSHAREDTHFGLCTSREAIREVFKKHGTRFLPNQFDKNAVFYLRMKNRFASRETVAVMDFTKDHNMEKWLSRASLTPLEEMTALNQYSFSTSTPLLVAFVDPADELKTADFLQRLESLGSKFLARINFVWVDFRDNLLLMIRLGLEGHRYPSLTSLPCVGLESPHGMQEAYRLDGDHTDLGRLDGFLEGFLQGKLQHSLRAQIDSSLLRGEQNLELLSDTQPLDYMDFDALLKDEALDGVVFFHNSSLDSDTQRRASSSFNRVASIAKHRLKLTTVVFASYDFARNRLPEDFFNDQEFVPGAVYLLPASQRRGPFLKWRASGQQRTGSDLLRFCAEHLDIRISPDLSAAGLSAEDLRQLGLGGPPAPEESDL